MSDQGQKSAGEKRYFSPLGLSEQGKKPGVPPCSSTHDVSNHPMTSENDEIGWVLGTYKNMRLQKV